MSKLFIIIGGIIMVGVFHRLYEIAKMRHIVRKFYKKMDQVNLLYELYTISKCGEIAEERVDIFIKLDIKAEYIECLLGFVQETISYYDKNGLRDFQIDLINECYSELIEIGIELRRWLLVNATK